MGRRSGAFGAFAAAANTLPTKAGAFSRLAEEAPNGVQKPVVPSRNSKKPAPDLSLDEVRRLLEELRTVSSSGKFQKDLAELRRMDWGAFKKREAFAKLLSIFWKATLRKYGFSIDATGFPNLLHVVKEHGQQPGIRLVSHEVERQLRMVPGALFRLTAAANGAEVKSWKEEEIESSRKTAEKPKIQAATKLRQELSPQQVRGRPMFLGEAKELLKAFREALLAPAVVRTMQNIEQRGGPHMEQHRRVCITQEWNPIMKRFDFPTTEDGYNAMKAGIREFEENEYVRSCSHEVEHLCGTPPGSYFGVPTAEEIAARRAAEAEAAKKAEETARAEEAARAEEKRKAEEARRQAEEAQKKAAEEKRKAEEAKRKAEEEAKQQEELRKEEQRRQEENLRQEAEAKAQEAAETHRQEEEAKRKEEASKAEASEAEEQKEADDFERLAEEARERATALRSKEAEELAKGQGNDLQDEPLEVSSKDIDEMPPLVAAPAQDEAEAAGTGINSQEQEETDKDSAAVKEERQDIQPQSGSAMPRSEGLDQEQQPALSKATDLSKTQDVQQTSLLADALPEDGLSCFDVALTQVALREQPSTGSRIVGAANRGAQLLGMVETVEGQQWLRVSAQSCCHLGALASSAWVQVSGEPYGLGELLRPAEKQEPQPLGYAGRYEVAHSKVAVRATPSVRGKIIGVVYHGRILMGTPHRSGGFAWLRFEESSRKKVAEGEEAWALIDGELLGLGQLLRPLDKDGRRSLESFHAEQVVAPPEADLKPEPDSMAEKPIPLRPAMEKPRDKPAENKGGKLGADAKADTKPADKQEPGTVISDPAKVESRRKAAQQAREVLSGPVEYKVLAQDHAAPVRREPLVQSPEVGKLERGRVVLGYPGGGWLQLVAEDEADRKLDGCWVFIGTRLSAEWAELNVTGEFEGALELSWLGLRKEKRVAYNVEWRTPEGVAQPKKGHKVSGSTKVLVSGLPQGCELNFRVGARVAASGDQEDQDVRLWGSWTPLLTGQFS